MTLLQHITAAEPKVGPSPGDEPSSALEGAAHQVQGIYVSAVLPRGTQVSLATRLCWPRRFERARRRAFFRSEGHRTPSPRMPFPAVSGFACLSSLTSLQELNVMFTVINDESCRTVEDVDSTDQAQLASLLVDIMVRICMPFVVDNGWSVYNPLVAAVPRQPWHLSCLNSVLLIIKSKYFI